MFIVIGAKRIWANGNAKPESKSAPPKISIILMIGNIYPVAAKAPRNAPPSGDGGGRGMNCKNPFNPNTR